MPSKRRRDFSAVLEQIEQVLRRGKRHKQPVSLVVVDVDDFEAYCKHNGQAAGKKTLQAIDRLLGKSCRETDSRVWLAGGVFSIILPATSKLDAGMVAERTRMRIERTDFPGEKKQPGGALTASLSVATYPGDASDSSELVGCADRALYLAKATGKNRVQLYDDNRRSRGRKEVALTGDFSAFEIDHHPLTTVDLSPSGVRFTTDRPVPVGVLLDIRLRIPELEREIEMAVRVVRAKEIHAPSFGWIFGRAQTLGGCYEVAVRTLEIPRTQLRHLMRYLWGDEEIPG